MFNLIINNKYKLSQLTTDLFKSEEINLKDKKIIFICNYPDDQFHKKLNITRCSNYSINRKLDILNIFHNDSILISPTDILNNTRFKTFTIKNITYLGSLFRNKRINQIMYSIQILKIILFTRKSKNILFYNIEFPIFFIAYILKLFRYQIFLDFEDNYNLIRKNKIKNIITTFSYKIIDIIIVNNLKSKRFFKNKITFLYYGNLNLNYLDNIPEFTLYEGINLFFSSTLDSIRGASILPELCEVIRGQIKNFTIYVSGTGELSNFVSNIQNVHYLGYINDQEYLSNINKCAACLVLQLPDAEFSNGSFPSKIYDYSKYKKPILILKNV